MEVASATKSFAELVSRESSSLLHSDDHIPGQESTPSTLQHNSDHADDVNAAMETLKGYILAELTEESAKELSSWPELDAYIDDLCSQGLEKLVREPDALSAEGMRLRSQLEDVSCRNYRALIQSFECARAVREGVGKVRTCLDQLVDALPSLASTAKEFAANGATHQTDRENKLRTLAEHGRIIDILEMPRLMRSLLSEELYDDALELNDLSVKLKSLHPDEPIIQSVCVEIKALTRQMILQLLMLLQNQVQLPICLRIIGYLRRLSVFSEVRLRALFLHCRGEWMQTVLETVTGPNIQARLVRLCDETRAMTFEIITQYRAAFGDEEDDSSDPSTNKAQVSVILHDWTSSRISIFLASVEDGLGDVRDGASLASVLQQAMYCGQSLGRVGADFRPALVPLFEAALMNILNSHLNAALRQFEVMIEDQRWAPVGSVAAARKGSSKTSDVFSGAKELSTSSERGASSNNNMFSRSTASDEAATLGITNESYDPPDDILDSPALAVFTNGLLSALNELRCCALISLSSLVAARVRETLLQAAECMSSVGGPGGAFLKRADRTHFASMQSSLRELCVPHIARCLDCCLDQNGLLDITLVHEEMREIFGEAATPKIFIVDPPSDHACRPIEQSPVQADKAKLNVALCQTEVEDAGS